MSSVMLAVDSSVVLVALMPVFDEDWATVGSACVAISCAVSPKVKTSTELVALEVLVRPGAWPMLEKLRGRISFVGFSLRTSAPTFVLTFL